MKTSSLPTLELPSFDAGQILSDPSADAHFLIRDAFLEQGGFFIDNSGLAEPLFEAYGRWEDLLAGQIKTINPLPKSWLGMSLLHGTDQLKLRRDLLIVPPQVGLISGAALAASQKEMDFLFCLQSVFAKLLPLRQGLKTLFAKDFPATESGPARWNQSLFFWRYDATSSDIPAESVRIPEHRDLLRVGLALPVQQPGLDVFINGQWQRVPAGKRTLVYRGSDFPGGRDLGLLHRVTAGPGAPARHSAIARF